MTEKLINLGIVSGVEPHRTIMEQKLTDIFLESGQRSIIIQGKPSDSQSITQTKNLTIYSEIDDATLAYFLKSAQNIFCRPGYSTIMDFRALQIKRAIFIPTPGQTEQLYLAKYHKTRGFTTVEQKEFYIDKQRCRGKIAVVTGANSGFGFGIAQQLIEYGIEVVLACRNSTKAADAIIRLKKEYPQAVISHIPLDLTSFGSVKNFVQKYRRRHQGLDFLINNAGTLFVDYKLTEDGFEQIFQTNYLSPFLLTNLMLPLICNKGRIITQNSVVYKNGKIDFSDINRSKNYSKWAAYSQSKLASAIFAIELQRRLEAEGSGIKSVLCHPGISLHTDLVKLRLIKKMGQKVCSFFSHSIEKGATTAIVAALSDEVKGGDFVGLDGLMQVKGDAIKIKIDSKATNSQTAQKLWEFSEKCTREHGCWS